MFSESAIKAGQSIYTPFLLKIYNLLVLNISNYWIWRCPKRYQLEQYQRYVQLQHLDIGVGTGFYLKNMRWAENAELSLMDLNPDCLKAAEKAVTALSPTCYLSDIFKQQTNLAERFDSISINYLLHCLPGNMNTKSIAIKNAVDMLKPQGILFGATILSDPEFQNFLSTRLMAFYNTKRIFSNTEDKFLLLKEMLGQYLTEIDIQIMGCVALFKGTKKT